MKEFKFPKPPEFPEASSNNELRAKYREVLITNPIGKDVLISILTDLCHFGCYLQSEYQVAQYNVGISILGNCGILGPGMGPEVINALANVVPKR